MVSFEALKFGDVEIKPPNPFRKLIEDPFGTISEGASGVVQKVVIEGSQIADRQASALLGTAAAATDAALGGVSVIEEELFVPVGILSEDEAEENRFERNESRRKLGDITDNFYEDVFAPWESADERLGDLTSNDPFKVWWDLGFDDTAENVGDTLAYMLDEDYDDEGELRAQVAKLEDEALLAMFTIVPLSMLPALRIILAGLSAGALKLILGASLSLTALPTSLLNQIHDGLGLTSGEEGDESLEESEDDSEDDDSSSEEEVSETAEKPPEEEVETVEPVEEAGAVESLPEPSVPLYSTGVPGRSKYENLETFY